MADIVGSMMAIMDLADEQFIQKLDAAGQRFEATGQKMQEIGKNMTAAVTLPLAALGALSLNTAAETEGALAKFDTVFRGLTDQMNDWVDSFRSNFPIARGQIIKMAADLQDLLVPMGVNREVAAGMTQDWFHLAGALAAFNDVPIQEALEAIRSGIAGQTEPLRRFGINAQVAAVQQEALAMGLITTGEEMSAQVKQQALLSLAMRQSSDALNGLEDQQGSLLFTMEETKAQIRDVADGFGELLLPAALKGAQGINKILDSVNDMDPAAKGLALTIAGVAAATGPLLLVLGALPAVASGAAIAMGALETAMLFIMINPWTLVIGGIVAALGALALAADDTADTVDRSFNETFDNAIARSSEVRDSRISDIHAERDAQLQAVDENIENLREQYDVQKEEGGAANKEAISQIRERLSAEKERHREAIDAINDEYGVVRDLNKSMTDVVNDEYDKQTEIINDALEERIALIDEGLRKTKEAIEEDTGAREQELQDQINAIDAATKAEELARREARLRDRIDSTRAKLEEEKDEERLLELKKDLAEEEAELKRFLLEQEREAEKAALRERIEEIQSERDQRIKFAEDAAETAKVLAEETANKEILEAERIKNEKIAKIQEERLAKIEAETIKHEATVISLEAQLKAQEQYNSSYKKALDEQLEELIATEEAKRAEIRKTAELEEEVERVRSEREEKFIESLRERERIERESAERKKQEANEAVGNFGFSTEALGNIGGINTNDFSTTSGANATNTTVKVEIVPSGNGTDALLDEMIDEVRIGNSNSGGVLAR